MSNKSENKNTTKPETPAAAPTTPTAKSAPTKKETENTPIRGSVIVLEDSDPSRNVIKFFLEKNDYKVYEYRNGREALDYLKKNDIADLKLVFTDIMMPEIDGLEFLRKLKEMNKFSSVPVLITSAMTDKGAIVEAKRLGVAGYLLKPTSIKKLTEVLRKMFPKETFIDISAKF